MRRRTTAGAGALVGVAILACLSAPAQAKEAGAVLVTTENRGCTEVAYSRNGLESVVRPLVPERYALVPSAYQPPGGPARVNLGVNEYTCRVQVTEDGRRTRQRDVTGIVVYAEIRTPEGKGLDEVYGLLLATEDRAQRRAFADAGWPVDLLARRSTADLATSPGGLFQATFTVRGGGWSHTLEAATVAAFGEPGEGRAVVVRDVGDRELRLCFDNEVAVVDGSFTGDQTRTPLAPLAVTTIYAGFPGQLATGGWRGTLTTAADCPAS